MPVRHLRDIDELALASVNEFRAEEHKRARQTHETHTRNAHTKKTMPVPHLDELALASINEQQVEHNETWTNVLDQRYKKRERDECALEEELEVMKRAMEAKKQKITLIKKELKTLDNLKACLVPDT